MSSEPSLQNKIDRLREAARIAGVDWDMTDDGTVSARTAPSSSGAPSPPSSSGSGSPSLRIAPCPPRLQSLIPPFNYGTVDLHSVYRSSFPQDRNLEFMRRLKIKGILTLVDTQPSQGMYEWMIQDNIHQLTIQIATNKEGKIRTTTDSLCHAILFILDSANHPLHIHCNQGKHRTGCVVGCLRRIQGVPIDEIIQEYKAYASPKEREGDIALIRTFDPACVFEYAKRAGLLEGVNAKARGLTRVKNVYQLVDALATPKSRADSAFEEAVEVSMEKTGTAAEEEMEVISIDIDMTPTGVMDQEIAPAGKEGEGDGGICTEPIRRF